MPNPTRLGLLARLAREMNLPTDAAVALPTTITVAGRKVGLTDNELISECLCNAPLRDYLAGICKEVVS